jgi:ribonuclease HIII
MALAKALLDSTETFLAHLDLGDIGMGDGGIEALASLVYEGRMQQLEDLNLDGNNDLTDEGITALARAINVRGLPVLERLSIVWWYDGRYNVTMLGISASLFIL